MDLPAPTPPSHVLDRSVGSCSVWQKITPALNWTLHCWTSGSMNSRIGRENQRELTCLTNSVRHSISIEAWLTSHGRIHHQRRQQLWPRDLPPKPESLIGQASHLTDAQPYKLHCIKMTRPHYITFQQPAA